jgi:GNAT superfamily N-acetyltransferase
MRKAKQVQRKAKALAVLKTLLEMPKQPTFQPLEWEAGTRVEQVFGCPPSFARFLYREVGRHFHWVEHLEDSDAEIAARLARPGYELWLLTQHEAPAGYYELLRRDDGVVELLYFGLLPEFIGRGFGKRLLAHAIQRAWALPTTCLWVNTCSLDGAAALPNYLASGFVVVKEEHYETPVVPQKCAHCRDLIQRARGLQDLGSVGPATLGDLSRLGVHGRKSRAGAALGSPNQGS